MKSIFFANEIKTTHIMQTIICDRYIDALEAVKAWSEFVIIRQDYQGEWVPGKNTLKKASSERLKNFAKQTMLK